MKKVKLQYIERENGPAKYFLIRTSTGIRYIRDYSSECSKVITR